MSGRQTICIRRKPGWKGVDAPEILGDGVGVSSNRMACERKNPASTVAQSSAPSSTAAHEQRTTALQRAERERSGSVNVRALGTGRCVARPRGVGRHATGRSEEHTSELQSRENLVCRLLLEKKKKKQK